MKIKKSEFSQRPRKCLDSRHEIRLRIYSLGTKVDSFFMLSNFMEGCVYSSPADLRSLVPNYFNSVTVYKTNLIGIPIKKLSFFGLPECNFLLISQASNNFNIFFSFFSVSLQIFYRIGHCKGTRSFLFVIIQSVVSIRMGNYLQYFFFCFFSCDFVCIYLLPPILKKKKRRENKSSK